MGIMHQLLTLPGTVGNRALNMLTLPEPGGSLVLAVYYFGASTCSTVCTIALEVMFAEIF